MHCTYLRRSDLYNNLVSIHVRSSAGGSWSASLRAYLGRDERRERSALDEAHFDFGCRVAREFEESLRRRKIVDDQLGFNRVFAWWR